MSIPIAAVAAMKSAFAAIGSMGPALQAGLAVASTATSYAGQKATANAQEAAIVQANESARVQAISDYDQMTRRGQQERAAGAQRIQQAAVDGARARGAAAASAGEAGIGGLSVNSLLTDIYGREASIRDGVNQNLDNTAAQMSAERSNIQRNLQNTIATRPMPQQPSLLGAGLEAATGVASAYRDKLKINSQLGNR